MAEQEKNDFPQDGQLEQDEVLQAQDDVPEDAYDEAGADVVYEDDVIADDVHYTDTADRGDYLKTADQDDYAYEEGAYVDTAPDNIDEREYVQESQPEPEPEAHEHADLDAQADAMLRDIEADGPYALRSHPDAEDLDPNEVPAQEEAEYEYDEIDHSAEELAAEDEVDELPESIEIEEEPQEYYVEEYDEEAEQERSDRTRRRLRNVLIFFIIVLIALGAAIGVFVWRNSMTPDVKQSDPDALQQPTAGTNTTVFQPISAEGIPAFVSFFGMTPEEAAQASGGAFSLDEAAVPTPEAQAIANAAAQSTSQRGSAQAAPTEVADNVVMATRGAWLVRGDGEVAAAITFGLNKDGKIISTSIAFDMDAYGVADAKFDELVADKTVSSSLLSAVGIDPAVASSAALSVKEKQDAVTSRDTSGLEQAEFSGETGRTDPPTTWKVYEIYDHSAGKALGDNSVIRTLTIELQ